MFRTRRVSEHAYKPRKRGSLSGILLCFIGGHRNKVARNYGTVPFACEGTGRMKQVYHSIGINLAPVHHGISKICCSYAISGYSHLRLVIAVQPDSTARQMCYSPAGIGHRALNKVAVHAAWVPLHVHRDSTVAKQASLSVRLRHFSDPVGMIR